MSYLFETEWEHKMSIMAGETVVNIDSVVSARLYSSSPSTAQKNDHAYGNADALVAETDAGQFSEDATTGEWTLTMPAVTNPDTSKTGGYERYYLVVSYKTASGGANQSTVEAVFFYYPEAISQQFSAAVADIDRVESRLSVIKGSTWVEGKIAQAEMDLLERWRSAGIPRNAVEEDDAKNQVVYLAAWLGCVDLATDDGEVWLKKAVVHEEMFNRIYDRYRLRYDNDDDGEIAPDERESTGVAFMMA